MISQDKIDAVKKYLISEFAECSVEDKYYSNREIHIFTVFHEKKKFITMVSEKIFENNSSIYIFSLAKMWQLSQKLRDNPECVIIVTKELSINNLYTLYPIFRASLAYFLEQKP